MLKSFTLFNLEGTGKNVPKDVDNGYGGLAQLGERLPCKQEVSGSIPLISTKKLTEATRNCCFIEFLEKEIQRCTLKTEHRKYYDAIMRRQHKRENLFNWVKVQF